MKDYFLPVCITGVWLGIWNRLKVQGNSKWIARLQTFYNYFMEKNSSKRLTHFVYIRHRCFMWVPLVTLTASREYMAWYGLPPRFCKCDQGNSHRTSMTYLYKILDSQLIMTAWDSTNAEVVSHQWLRFGEQMLWPLAVIQIFKI